MKGNGGVYVIMGTGAVCAQSSTKSKIKNIVSSTTETEVISVGAKIPKHLWFRNFAVEQLGEPSQIHVLYQEDNKSTNILQNSGCLSCGKGSKLIHIRYFFITDRIK